MSSPRRARQAARDAGWASRAALAMALGLLVSSFQAAAKAPATLAAPTATHLCLAAIRDIEVATSRSRAQGSPGALVAVTQHGRSLFSAGYGFADLEHAAPLTRDAVFPLASLTKMFTAAAILKLHAQGRLSLDAAVSSVLPGMPRSLDAVRVRDLVVQTSGIPDFAADAEMLRTRSVARTRPEMLAIIARMAEQPHFHPGERWEYSNANYVLLGAIIEQVTGEDLEAAFASLLFRPAGIDSIRFDDPAAIVPHRTRGYRRDAGQPTGFANAAWLSPTIPGAAGGLRSTAADLMRWSEALFGGLVLPSDIVELMISPGKLRDGRSTRAGMPKSWQEGLKSDYAMGLFVRPDTPGGMRLWHSGELDGFATWFAHYPESGVTIVQMINSESADLESEAVETAVFRTGRRPCTEPER